MLGGEMVGRNVGYLATLVRGNAVGDDERPRMDEADFYRIKKTINQGLSPAIITLNGIGSGDICQ